MIEIKVNERYVVLQEAKDEPFYFYDEYMAMPVYRAHYIEGDDSNDLLEFDTLSEAINWANDTFKKKGSK